MTKNRNPNGQRPQRSRHGTRLDTSRRLAAERLEDRRLLAAVEYPYHNEQAPLDVNDDGHVTLNDALQVLNALENGGSRELDPHASSGSAFIDTTKDNFLSPRDALLVVNALHRPVVAQDDVVTVAEDSSASLDVLANDFLIAGSTGTLELDPNGLTQPNGTASIDNGRVLYTPAPNYFGTDTFTYTAIDGLGNSDVATVFVTVENVNDPPQLTLPDNQSVNEDTSLSFGVSDFFISDVDAGSGTLQVTLSVNDGTLTLSTATNLTFSAGNGSDDATMTFTGTLTDLNNALDTLSYQGNQDFNGIDTLSVSVDDQGNTGGPALQDAGFLVIDVLAVNDQPIANDDTFSAILEDSVNNSLNVLNNDSILPDTGETLMIIQVGVTAGDGQTSQGGTVEIDGDRVVYTPLGDFFGTDTFSYTISDDNGGTDTALVKVTVEDVAEPVVGFRLELQSAAGVPIGQLLDDQGTPVVNPDDGQPVYSVWLDDEFRVQIYVDDLRADDPNGGVFAAGMDIAYNNPALFSLGGTKPDDFTDLGQFGSFFTGSDPYEVLSVNPSASNVDSDSVPDEFDELSAYDGGIIPLGPDEQPVAHVTLTADQVGDLNFQANAAEMSETLLYGPDDSVDSSMIDFGAPLHIKIVQPPVKARHDAVTVAEDSSALSINVLENDELIAGSTGTLALDPNGLTQPNGTASITNGQVQYTPNPDFFGTDTFNYIAIDGLGNADVATVTVTVEPVNDPPQLTLPGNQSVNEDTTLTFSVSDISISDVDAGSGELQVTFSVNDGTLTLGTSNNLTFSAGNGSDNSTMTFTGSLADLNNSLDTLSYQGNQDFSGTDMLSVSVNDQGNTGGPDLQDSGTLDIDVLPVNDPPVANEDSFTGILEDSVNNPLDVLENDSIAPDEGETLTITKVGDNAASDNGRTSQGGTVHIDGNQVVYTPQSDFFGTDTFRYTISDDNGGTNTAMVEVTVEDVPEPVVGFRLELQSAAGVPIEQLQDNQGNPVVKDGQPVYAVRLEDEFRVQVYVDDLRPDDPNAIRGVFAAGMDIAYNNPALFSLGGTKPDDFTDLDQFRSFFTASDPYAALSVAPSFSDVDNDGDTDEFDELSAFDGFDPLGPDERPFAYVTLTADQVGDLNFQANAAERFPQSETALYGPDAPVDPNVIDFGFPLHIKIVQPPVNARDDAVTVAEDSFLETIDVLANDVLEAGSTGALALGPGGLTPPANGTASIDNGRVLYTPAPDFFGTDTFNYTAIDGLGNSDVAMVTITVENVNDPPVANADRFTIVEDTVENSLDVLANDLILPDEGETLAITKVGSNVTGDDGQTSQGGTVAFNDQVAYTPPSDFFGTDTFTYTISDDNGGTDTAQVTVTVQNVNDDPTANDDELTAVKNVANQEFDVLANDTEFPDEDETLIIMGLGAKNEAIIKTVHGTAMISQGGTIIYSPDTDFETVGNDADTFTYTISDLDGGTDSATVRVTVIGVAQASVSGFVRATRPGPGGSPVAVGIPGVTLTLTESTSEDVLKLTTLTGDDGSYRFDGLRPGTYTVTETQPAAVLPSGSDTQTVELSRNEVVTGVNFDDGWFEAEPVSVRNLLESNYFDTSPPSLLREVIALGEQRAGRLAQAMAIRAGGSQTTVVITGTPDDDQFEFSANDPALHVLSVNGQRFAFASSVVEGFRIDGRGGSDEAYLVGSGSDDIVTLRPPNQVSTLQLPDYSLKQVAYLVSVEHVERVTAEGGGGNDRAYLFDSVTNDRLELAGNSAQLFYGGMSSVWSRSVDFDWVLAAHTAGGTDSWQLKAAIDFLFEKVGDWNELP